MQFLAVRKIISSSVIILTTLGSGFVYSDQPQELYEANCAACHGDDGAPLLPGTPFFSKGERLEKTDTELLKSIVNGLNVMPAWDGILNKKEMQDCLEHIRRLAS